MTWRAAQIILNLSTWTKHTNVPLPAGWSAVGSSFKQTRFEKTHAAACQYTSNPLRKVTRSWYTSICQWWNSVSWTEQFMLVYWPQTLTPEILFWPNNSVRIGWDAIALILTFAWTYFYLLWPIVHISNKYIAHSKTSCDDYPLQKT